MTSPRPHSSGRSAAVPFTVVHACLRDGTGGSPTAVVAETAALGPLDDETRRAVPALAGASHAVFLTAGRHDAEATVRFFTAEGELPACGHGTVAALAYLAERAGVPEYRATLHAQGRTVQGRADRQGDVVHAEFEVGPVDLRDPTTDELGALLPALGLPLVSTARIATLGRPRLLARVPHRASLEAMSPDLRALAEACRELDLLGCYAYAAPGAPGRHYAARMFAPAVGVPEDIANANSTACLAALLHAAGGLGAARSTGAAVGRGVTGAGATVAVDMGDRLGSPATISASVSPGTGAAAPLVRVGGAARVGTRARNG